MKYILHFVTLICLISCTKEQLEQEQTVPFTNLSSVEDCDFDLGSYHLLNSTISQFPYLKKTEIVFVDSLGNETSFIVRHKSASQHFGELPYTKVMEINKISPDKAITYCMKNDFSNYYLRSDILNITFQVESTTKPDLTDVHKKQVADVLNIFVVDEFDKKKSYSIYYKTLNSRNHSRVSNLNETLDGYTIFGKTFDTVERTPYANPKVNLFYNDDMGIAAFKDRKGCWWRFERWQ